MKHCINKLLLLGAVSSMIAGPPMYSMEQVDGVVSRKTSAVSPTASLLEEFRALHDVLKRYIIFLALEERISNFICSSILKGHTERITSVAFSPDGKTVLTGSYGKTACLWNVITGEPVQVPARYMGNVFSEVFSPAGERLHAIIEHTEGIISVAFSPDGKTVLTGSYDKTACLWNVTTGERLHTFKGHTRAIMSVAFSLDGKTVLTGSSDKTACLWNATTGERLLIFTGHTERISSVAFSPDGKNVLTGSHDNTVRLWNASTGEQLQVLIRYTRSISSVAFSPDGKTVITGSYDHTACLWNATTGALLQVLRGHISDITSVAFSPDGKTIITGSGDNAARLWKRFQWNERTKALFMKYYSLLTATVYTVNDRVKGTILLGFTNEVDVAK